MPDTNDGVTYGVVGVNMNSLFHGSQALTLDSLGKGFVAQQTRQAGIFDRKLDEIDVGEAQANRYALTGTPNESTASANR